MTTEERLRQAATIGDEMAELLSWDALDEGQRIRANRAQENWHLLMADCQRAGEIDSPTAPTGFEEHGA